MLGYLYYRMAALATIGIHNRRAVPTVSGLILKDKQHNNSDQFIFLHNLRELQCTFSMLSASSVFQSCRKVYDMPEVSQSSPQQTW